jgi:acetylornithine deacetylase/succinyl-diaminopimelate desuccinylase-like protein
MGLTRPELEQFASKSREQFERLLKELVEIPSVSAEPDRSNELERCAELGAATIRDFGGQAEIHRIFILMAWIVLFAVWFLLNVALGPGYLPQLTG